MKAARGAGDGSRTRSKRPGGGSHQRSDR